MNQIDLIHFKDLLKRRAGIDLALDKDYLVQSRLAAIAGTAGFESVDAMLQGIRLRPSEAVIAAAVDAMTTNETFFFRDGSPFEHLRKIILAKASRKKGPIRIWSAACSTGQEPYSIAMLWEELSSHLPGVSLDLLATDLSATCVAKAQAGLYSAYEAQRGLPVQKLMKHFDPEGPNWKVKPYLRQSITWKRHNLLDSPHALGVFDVVFCRNVLIYFERETRRRILDSIAAQLVPGGHLLLGVSESVLGVSNAFKANTAAPGLYEKVEAQPDSTRSVRLAV